MLGIILSWLGGPIAKQAFQTALDGYKAKIAAGNTSEKIAADLAAQQAAIDYQREAAEQETVRSEESRYWPIVRWGFAFPFMLFNFKIIIWDRMLHWGITEPLSADLIQLEMIIVTAYFGHSALTNMAQLLKPKKG